MWEPRRLRTLWAFTAYYRDSLTFYIYNYESLFLIKCKGFLNYLNECQLLKKDPMPGRYEIIYFIVFLYILSGFLLREIARACGVLPTSSMAPMLE
jgi:hypothetical protein